MDPIIAQYLFLSIAAVCIAVYSSLKRRAEAAVEIEKEHTKQAAEMTKRLRPHV